LIAPRISLQTVRTRYAAPATWSNADSVIPSGGHSRTGIPSGARDLELVGGWREAQKAHFDDGASFDQIYALAGR